MVVTLTWALAATLLPPRAWPSAADRGGDGARRQVTEALARSLRSSGRARASFERESLDPLSGSAVTLKGELVHHQLAVSVVAGDQSGCDGSELQHVAGAYDHYVEHSVFQIGRRRHRDPPA